jgi:hypothetical protein
MPRRRRLLARHGGGEEIGSERNAGGRRWPGFATRQKSAASCSWMSRGRADALFASSGRRCAGRAPWFWSIWRRTADAGTRGSGCRGDGPRPAPARPRRPYTGRAAPDRADAEAGLRPPARALLLPGIRGELFVRKAASRNSLCSGNGAGCSQPSTSRLRRHRVDADRVCCCRRAEIAWGRRPVAATRL